ncbi:MAG: PEP-CTERM sorting domain-containing protein [Phycisphaeraceae bacterium]|nr:PEP-CTERM sorting domain-containing protein [Phycisphaeraceae bacterium]
MVRNHLWIFVLGVMLGVTTGEACADIRYTVTDLGTLGGSSRAYALNDHGQVVGVSELGTGTAQSLAFVWDSVHGLQQLAGLQGDLTYAKDINNQGIIVGGATDGQNQLKAMLWHPQTGPQILSPGADYSGLATSINNLGQVVIQANQDGVQGTQLVTWDQANGFAHYGRLYGTEAMAWDNNDAGQVALVWDAMKLRPGQAVRWDPVDGFWFIGNESLWQTSHNLNATSGDSFAINAQGDVAGAFYFPVSTSNKWQAFVWLKTHTGTRNAVLLGDPLAMSIAWSINDSQVVVGTSNPVPFDPAGDGDELHAFIAHLVDKGTNQEHFEMLDLNSLLVPNTGWVLREALDINNKGQIVGWGINPQGQERAFLLNVVVPEPSTATVMLLGVGLCCRRRRP